MRCKDVAKGICKHNVLLTSRWVCRYLGPYDKCLPGATSAINWFYVSNSLEDLGQPKKLAYGVANDTQFPKAAADELVRRCLFCWIRLLNLI